MVLQLETEETGEVTQATVAYYTAVIPQDLQKAAMHASSPWLLALPKCYRHCTE